MPFGNVKAKQIKGLIPAVDPRAIEQPFVVRGQNFLVDLKGIRSYFFNEILSYQKLNDLNLARAFDCSGNTILMMNGYSLKYDAGTNSYRLQYTFTDDGSIYPWSMAKVGNFYYFAKKGVAGIVKYDPATETWTFITVNLPSGVCAVSRSTGRLVALGTNFVAWSSQDNGDDFAPSTVTGAGFQGLSIVNGTGITVKEVTDGFITFTSAGTIKSEFTNGPNPFRHYPFDRQIVPINAFCVVDTENFTHVVMDRKGLFSSSGQAYRPFEPMMGEYFAHELMPTLNLELDTAFRLFNIDNKKLLFVSIGSPNFPDRCAQSYVFYTPRGEWALFVSDHYQILDLSETLSATISSGFGYTAPDQYIRYFNEGVVQEDAPEISRQDLSLYIDYSETQGSFSDGGVWQARSGMEITTEDPGEVNQGTGLYPKYFDITGAQRYSFTPVTLNSFIEIGMFRFEQGQYDDEIGLVTDVALGVDQQTGIMAVEDWLNDPTNIVEDYNTSTNPDDDWGSGVPVVSDYQVSIYGTNDGINIFDENEQVLDLKDDTQATRYYTCYVNGLYHIVRIEHISPNQMYYLKNLEVTGTMAGRLGA
jgi:hypothetical protein